MNITDFDKNTICDNTQLLKALITHLDFETQRLLATFVRLTELKLTMEYYSKNKFSCQGTSKEIDFKSILDDVKQYCSKEQQNMLNNISQMMNVYSMYSSFSDLSNLLNPEQMDLYKQFSSQINNGGF
ncbi:MAG: hypothetical protein E7252_01755 [Lachnospira sp.]|nr:hypothetical protein [Lachnospira sp.]